MRRARRGPVRAISDRDTFAALSRTSPLRAGPLWLRCRPDPVPSTDGDPEAPPRVAYAIGRAMGNAVVRNRIRRRLRAVVHERRDELLPGAAHLFGGDRRLLALGYADLHDAVSTVLHKVKTSTR